MDNKSVEEKYNKYINNLKKAQSNYYEKNKKEIDEKNLNNYHNKYKFDEELREKKRKYALEYYYKKKKKIEIQQIIL